MGAAGTQAAGARLETARQHSSAAQEAAARATEYAERMDVDVESATTEQVRMAGGRPTAQLVYFINSHVTDAAFPPRAWQACWGQTYWQSPRHWWS